MEDKNNNINNQFYIKSKITNNISPNSKIIKEYKKIIKNLSQIQWETSIGLMLGDVSLQTQNKGVRKSYRIKFEWGEINKIYAEHVHEIFNEWILSKPHKKVRINKNKKTVITWGFQTISHTAFNNLADLFLNEKGKMIKNNLIKDQLSGRGLAYWFMDDGGKLDYNKNSKNKSLVLNTHSFTKEEVHRMSVELSEKFNLCTNVKLNKNKNIIIIESESYETFLKIVNPYIIPSMRYKLIN